MKQLTQEQVVGLVAALAGLALMVIVIYSAKQNPYFTDDMGYHIVFIFGMILTCMGIWVCESSEE